MEVYSPSTNDTYYDLYSEVGVIDSEDSIRIYNSSSNTIYVVQGGIQPIQGSNIGRPIPSREDSYISGADTIWVSGTTGPLVVSRASEYLPTAIVTSVMPRDLYTTEDENYRRIRVDVAQTSFFRGMQFRAYYEFDIPNGNSRWLRFTSATDFVLFSQELVVDKGDMRFAAYLDATPSGTYSTPVPIIGKNRMSSIPSPAYVSQISIDTGGAASGGTEVDLMRVISPSSTSKEVSVGGTLGDERGLPAGTYYLELRNIANSGNATGIYRLFWEER